MKPLYTLTLLLVCRYTLQAQFTEALQVNDVSALFNANGFLFNAADLSETGYQVPYDPTYPLSTIFASNIWLAGLDEGEQLHIAAQTYRQTGDDFWPGPIANDHTGADYITAYHRVWPVDAAVVEAHRDNWDSPGYVMPDQITNWPGNGNTANGEAAQLAPYFDHNNNLIYDPANGDYPLIRGDQAVFMIFNDAAETHMVTGGEPLGVEIHAMAYGYDLPADSALFQTTFLNFKIINRSAQQYSACRLGLWSDLDIGAYLDDYVGSDTILHMYFGYNGDLMDGPGVYQYGDYPPAQGVVFLNHDLSVFKSYSNDMTVTGNPFSANDHWNYLQGNWLDGTPQTAGGDGYGGAIPSPFLYPGHPLDATAWSEVTAGNFPFDRRGLGVMTIGDLLSGDTACVDMAFVTAFSYSSLIFNDTVSDLYHLNAVQVLKERVEEVRTFYDTNFSDCSLDYTANPDFSAIPDLGNSGLVLFPNPGEQMIFISGLDKHLPIRFSTIININGQEVSGQISVPDMQDGISIENLNPGLYYLMIQYANGDQIVEPFAKQ